MLTNYCSSRSHSVATQASCSTLLFHRISEVMLKCVRSGRPLLHIVRAWSVVGPHLMEVLNTVVISEPRPPVFNYVYLLFISHRRPATRRT